MPLNESVDQQKISQLRDSNSTLAKKFTDHQSRFDVNTKSFISEKSQGTPSVRIAANYLSNNQWFFDHHGIRAVISFTKQEDGCYHLEIDFAGTQDVKSGFVSIDAAAPAVAAMNAISKKLIADINAFMMMRLENNPPAEGVNFKVSMRGLSLGGVCTQAFMPYLLSNAIGESKSKQSQKILKKYQSSGKLCIKPTQLEFYTKSSPRTSIRVAEDTKQLADLARQNGITLEGLHVIQAGLKGKIDPITRLGEALALASDDKVKVRLDNYAIKNGEKPDPKCWRRGIFGHAHIVPTTDMYSLECQSSILSSDSKLLAPQKRGLLLKAGWGLLVGLKNFVIKPLRKALVLAKRARRWYTNYRNGNTEPTNAQLLDIAKNQMESIPQFERRKAKIRAEEKAREAEREKRRAEKEALKKKNPKEAGRRRLAYLLGGKGKRHNRVTPVSAAVLADKPQNQPALPILPAFIAEQAASNSKQQQAAASQPVLNLPELPEPPKPSV